MRKTVGISAALVFFAMLSNASQATSKLFTVNRMTEHKLVEFYGLGGEEFCVYAHKLNTKEVARFGVRRSLNGHPKHLDFHKGRVCFKTKPGVYVVYASAPDMDLRVTIEFDGGPNSNPHHDPIGNIKPKYN